VELRVKGGNRAHCHASDLSVRRAQVVTAIRAGRHPFARYVPLTAQSIRIYRATQGGNPNKGSAMTWGSAFHSIALRGGSTRSRMPAIRRLEALRRGDARRGGDPVPDPGPTGGHDDRRDTRRCRACRASRGRSADGTLCPVLPSHCLDAARSQIVLFGGNGGNGNYLGDTWTWGPRVLATNAVRGIAPGTPTVASVTPDIRPAVHAPRSRTVGKGKSVISRSRAEGSRRSDQGWVRCSELPRSLGCLPRWCLLHRQVPHSPRRPRRGIAWA
jgi:hypothetical protein